jgi:CheY-like chemotaxis protein
MKKKIIVIEDNYTVRDNLCEILELADYDVDSAENGKIGIEKIRLNHPDLIICDVMMPVLDGYGVLKILNKDPQVNHIPFIFLTAKSEKEDQRKGMGLGATDYITKPFDDVELLEAIEIRLDKAAKLQSTFLKAPQELNGFFSEVKANADLIELTDNREIRKYKAKDQIYEVNGTPRWLYFLSEGQVKLYYTNEVGKELITQVVREGEFFGFNDLLDDKVYQQSAAALKDSEIRLIPKADFTSMLFSNRDFSIQFIKMISNKAIETERQVIEMAYNSVRKKVANALISFATQSNNSNIQNIIINQSREDLAAKAGTAKETLIRTLSDFKDENLLKIEARQITITDLNILKELIG